MLVIFASASLLWFSLPISFHRVPACFTNISASIYHAAPVKRLYVVHRLDIRRLIYTTLSIVICIKILICLIIHYETIIYGLSFIRSFFSYKQIIMLNLWKVNKLYYIFHLGENYTNNAPSYWNFNWYILKELRQFIYKSRNL